MNNEFTTQSEKVLKFSDHEHNLEHTMASSTTLEQSPKKTDEDTCTDYQSLLDSASKNPVKKQGLKMSLRKMTCIDSKVSFY